MLGRFDHAACWLTEHDEQPELGLRVIHRSVKVADHAGIQLASTLHGHDDGANSVLVSVEADPPVDPMVADLLLVGLAIDERNGPTLEVERILREESLGARDIGGDAMNLVCTFDLFAVGVTETLSDQVNCEVRDVDPNPPSAQILRRVDRGAAPTEWIKDDVPLVRRSPYDSLQ